MKTSVFLVLLFILQVLSTGVMAEEKAANEAKKAPTNEQAEGQKKPDDDETDPLSGAQITIIESKDRTIETYKVNGHIVQIKIIPKNGYPYYLIDTDGDGRFDLRSAEAWRRTTVNTWKIYQW